MFGIFLKSTTILEIPNTYKALKTICVLDAYEHYVSANQDLEFYEHYVSAYEHYVYNSCIRI